MRKIFTLLIVAILATATSWADTWTWTASTMEDLGTKTTAAVTLNGKDWTVTRDKVNYTNFTYGCIQLGKSKAPEQVTLTTSAFSGKQISSVSISCASYRGAHKCSIKVGDKVVLTKQSTSTWSNDENSAKPISVEKLSGSGDISISFTDGTRALYIKSISVTYTESSEPQKTVKSLAITGEPTNKEYYVGDAFSADGLKVNATYDDDTQEDVTAKATWTLTPATFTDAGAVSVTATATYGGVSAETTCPVTVKTIANTKEGAYTVEQAIALIEAGKGLATPVYVKGVVSKIVTPYSTKYKNITFDVSDNGATTTPQFQFFRNQKDAENTYAEDPNIEVGATVVGYGILKKFNDTYEFDAGNYLVEYKAPAAKTLTSIAITGEPAKVVYETGESFNPEGLTVTATYDDESTADVTADATWTFDPAVFNTTGSVTVTALAAYGGKDGVAEYTVTVSAKPLTLTISPATGTYASAQTVTIEANNAVGNVAIYYTTDGSNPEEGANEYTAPFEVATTTTVKAYAIDDELRKATAESVITIKASTFAAENFNGCNTQGGRDGNFKIGSGDISDDSFDCGGWVYDATVYAANSCVRVGTKSNGSLTSPVVAGTNYNAISFDIAGWEDSKVNTLTVTINNGGTFADGATSKSFTATNAKWTTFTEKITGLTSATTFTFSGKRFFLDSIILMNASTLAELAENGTEGKEYTVNDEMVVAKKFQKNGKNYIVVKDAAKAVRNFSTPAADDKFFNINGNKQEEYAQNNWMLVSLPVELYNQVNEKNTVTSITGTLDEKLNVAMTATNVVAGEAADFAPNTYCPINFMGESSVKGNSTAYTSSYYFATPKANEYANVVWAVYNSNDGAFYLPTPQGSANAQGFYAAFCVDYSLNSVDNPELTDGSVYSFEALVKEETRSTPIYGAISTKFVVYPLDLDDTKVATGVNDVNSAKEVKGVSYFNMMGVESAQPFDGVNIMVTTYTDGTSSATKVLR